MNDYICKIATLDELKEKWDYEISIHKAKDKWQLWRDKAVKNHIDGNAILYIGKLNGVIICEATAMLNASDVQNSEGLVSDGRAYLTAFRTNEGYWQKGYFSSLYRFMENDLKQRGYKALTLGVEPSETRNIEIYHHFGFNTLIKTAYEIYPPDKKRQKPEKILVDYYLKDLG